MADEVSQDPASHPPPPQIDALRGEGIAGRHMYVDKKSGSTTNRPGLPGALDQTREGDVIVVHTHPLQLYRHLPPRPPDTLTAENQQND